MSMSRNKMTSFPDFRLNYSPGVLLTLNYTNKTSRQRDHYLQDILKLINYMVSVNLKELTI
jgi:hypothetical protein